MLENDVARATLGSEDFQSVWLRDTLENRLLEPELLLRYGPGSISWFERSERNGVDELVELVELIVTHSTLPEDPDSWREIVVIGLPDPGQRLAAVQLELDVDVDPSRNAIIRRDDDSQ